MIGRPDIPLSALRTNASRQSASAHNTANLQTDGFGKQRVTSEELKTGGVRGRLDTVELSDEGRKAAEEASGAQNNVEIAEESVEQIEARHATSTNAGVIRTMDRIAQSLLDLFR